MTHPDYRGHRGAVAGDDYHELWALRESLKLLEPNSGLTTVTVEGLRSEDEKGVPKDTWDGVDCTFYFGGEGQGSAERIVIDQVKFSGAKPNQPWTIARLTSAKNKKKDNSVIRRLATAFSGLKQTRPDLVDAGKIAVRLVSNQPISPAVINALNADTLDTTATKDRKFKADRKALLKASGIKHDDFDAFASVLDFSECGGDSPLKHEERILLTISSWTEDDARFAVTDLLRFVRNKMLPHEKGDVITRESILARLGVSDIAALFPCPSKIKPVTNFVPREESRILAARLMNGEQLICLHGEGSCGKTTSLQELNSLLPPNSLTIVFDCYGGGRYLDSDAYRHRPQDAFLHLSNELAQRLRLPLLITRAPELNYPQIFKKRLARAAEVVASNSSDALLVVVVDAADNSITAAATRQPPEKSFVHEFLALGELPNNVRLLVTSRTGRLPSLSLPPNFALHEIIGFTPDETVAYVHGRLPDVSSGWIEDFHHLSRGVPRVQSYALEFGEGDPDKTLNYLRPDGKSLNQVFAAQLELLRSKVGTNVEIKKFCSGLAALPHPIPITDIAAVTGLPKAHIVDLCNDLSPGIRLEDDLIGFADEEFENFVREEAQQELQSIRKLIADHFSARYKSDAYAATYIAGALLEADRGRQILDLINNEKEPLAIRDPILRRETQLQRLKIAMKVCRDNGNVVDAMMTMLIGAEALKTDVAIKTMLEENPDLAASFARDTSSRTILRDTEQIENHGSLLFQLMAADARMGDRISVREGYRQVRAWMERRTESFNEQMKDDPHFHPHGWDLSTSDITAGMEAILRIAGPRVAIEELFSWTPRTVALRVGSILPARLIISSDADLVEQCVNEIRPPWDLFLLVPLALSGQDIDLSRVLYSLAKLHRHRLIRLERLREPRDDETKSAAYLETVLTACEIVTARGGDINSVVPLLALFADPELRRVDRLATYQQKLIDLSMRAHTLLERIAGRKAVIDSYLITPLIPGDQTKEEIGQIQKRINQKKEELTTFIDPFIDLYDFRSQVLLGRIAKKDLEQDLQHAISRSHREDYKLRSEYRASGMRAEVALALTRLTMVQTLDTSVLLEKVCDVLEYGSSPFSANVVEVLDLLALDGSLHEGILSEVSARANAVKTAKASSEDKVAALVLFARLLMFLSHADSESVFTDAIRVAGEVNAEAVHELALFAPLARRAAQESGPAVRRAVAHNFTTVASDVAIRLEGQEHFPWAEIAETLTTLDIGVALASVARWEDAGIVGRSTLLTTVLQTALRQKTIRPRQICSLLSLLDEADEGLIEAIASEAKAQKADTDIQGLVSELSREELLRFGKGRRSSVSDSLNSLASKPNTDCWLQRLLQTTEFLSAQRDAERSAQMDSVDKVKQDQSDDPFADINWNEYTFTTPDEINRVVNTVSAAGRASKNYISEETILNRIAGMVAPPNRTAYLDALRRSTSLLIDHDGIFRSLVNDLRRWENVPSVATWASQNVLAAVIDELPLLSRWLIYRDSPLPALLERSQGTDADICESLLQGIERHVDSLAPATIYALIGLAGEYCRPDEATDVMQRYSQRLLERIAVADRDPWDLFDLPSLPDDVLARFLFALLGDADVRIRWRAGHAIRGLARLGDSAVLDKLTQLFPDRTVDGVFRRPDAPFYWLAARLWLVITFDRIATETPTSINKYSVWLLEMATDEKLPHFLIRRFAKSALSKLVGGGHVYLDDQQIESLRLVNSSPFANKKRKVGIRRAFHKYQYKAHENRRFTFNTMDTLPHWYSDVIGGFADVDAEEFLDVAEHWIVDQWGVRNDPWKWNAEPRRDRFSARSGSMSHRDGTLPTIERFNTYLEWHAMWCTFGELLRTRPLAKVADNDYDSFARELEKSDLATPPVWLADLRGPKPVESRLWTAPKDIDIWLTKVHDEDFLAEVTASNNYIVVDSYHDTRSQHFRRRSRVNTALVSPETASALVRALQTAHFHRYDVPKEDEELQINSPPYVFRGWLAEASTYDGIDDRDPLRFDVTGVQGRPGTEASVGLRFEHRLPGAVWVEPQSGSEVFVYESWGENKWDDRDDPVRFDENIRSSGWQLRMESKSLRYFLSQLNLDLLVEVKLDRHNRGYYEYSRPDEKTKEKTFVKILLFRQDGTIEDAGGRVGAWETFGPRTEPG